MLPEGSESPSTRKQHPVLTFSKAGELEMGEYGRLEMCWSLAWHLDGWFVWINKYFPSGSKWPQNQREDELSFLSGGPFQKSQCCGLWWSFLWSTLTTDLSLTKGATMGRSIMKNKSGKNKQTMLTEPLSCKSIMHPKFDHRVSFSKTI